jgi:hypothetical protein
MSLETDVDLRDRLYLREQVTSISPSLVTATGRDLDKMSSLVGLYRKGLSEDEVKSIWNEIANDIFG